MVEAGLSLARGLFAFNSVNTEGWGLYSEAVMLPYMPLDGQLISLQARLHRAARAFLDPELPDELMPDSTVRPRAVKIFHSAYEGLAQSAQRHFDSAMNA